MLMGSHHAVAGNPQTEWRVPGKPLQRDEYASDNELENRIKNLDKLVDSLQATSDQMSFSGKPHDLDLVNDLPAKITSKLKIRRLSWDRSRAPRSLPTNDCRSMVRDHHCSLSTA